MELVLMLGLFVILIIGLISLYNIYDAKVKRLEYKRNSLIKEYHYFKHISIDLLHANMIGNLISALDSKRSLKAKIQFIENL